MPKTKTHEFTYDELVALREACINEYLRLRDHHEIGTHELSEYAKKHFRIMEALKDQFKQDVMTF